ncbi:LPS export ABC transporter permease LptF [Pelovirga terrestris]|uniref:LPS export ABC transporter permease LptF n=1 Tax=Pelovirga terrestris TaxID=2771352 RepID=A0A8J6QLY1_9BACT|nr:LPS export ABC transporter permease LptF [Pelovirga terrestris]MBD1400939.1 LPS export ABC transporter permease LptF [Pelovirga terrestris]
MSQQRIHRYILREISIPAIMSLLIFSFVVLLGRIPRLTEMIISKGVPVMDIIALFAYLLPTFLSVTVPLSFLLGILLAFGRFSADSEYIAMKASGISLYSMVKPVAFLALIFTLLTAAITLLIEPASKSALRSKVFEIASTSLNVSIKPGVFNDDVPGIVLYAQGLDERQGIMRDVFISDERSDAEATTITASEGLFISHPENLILTLRLRNGEIHRQPAGTGQDTYQTISFNNYDINFDFSEQISQGQRNRSRGEMSWTELNQAIKAATPGKQRYRLAAELHERIVVAFAPLILILIGIPLGLQSQRSGKGAGFTLALVVFLVYYVLLSFAGTLADKGILPAALILWLPNLVFLGGGSFFLYRAASERPVVIHLHLWNSLQRLLFQRHRGGRL